MALASIKIPLTSKLRKILASGGFTGEIVISSKQVAALTAADRRHLKALVKTLIK